MTNDIFVRYVVEKRTPEKGDNMKKALILPAILMLSACGGVGQPSVGINANYNMNGSRAAFDNLGHNPDCHNHEHFDGCGYKTQVEDHVSPYKARYVRVPVNQK